MNVGILRVGIDNGNAGRLGPVFEDGSFEYIPIPESEETTETRSYSDIEARNGGNFAQFLPSGYSDETPHYDPEFEGYTYGDPTSKRSQLKRLNGGDLLIFYAGLQPKSFDDHPRLFIVGYFTIKRVLDLDELSPSERETKFQELSTNAHIKRTELSKHSELEDKNHYPVIVEGYPNRSRLLDRAIPLSDVWATGVNEQYHMLSGVSTQTGYSQNKDLNRASIRWLPEENVQKIRRWLDGEMPSLVDSDTALHTYVLRHDSGFAPNPSHGYCTLATCKPNIRSSAEVGDWVVGTGSLSKNDREERLLYAMRVDEVLTYDEYFSDERFEFKKPLSGKKYDENGDNIYYTSKSIDGEQYHVEDGTTYFRTETPSNDELVFTDQSEFVQVDNPHHPYDHIDNDTKHEPSRNAVLVSTHFWYFGEKEVLMPEDDDLRNHVIRSYGNPKGKIGEESTETEDQIRNFVSWLRSNYRPGVHGTPRDQSNNGEIESHSDCY